VKQEQFLEVVSPADAHARWRAALDLTPRPEETVPVGDALGRVLARDVTAPGDVPAFDRSNVDGFAVRAEDTFHASEREPAILHLTGRPVDAGHAPRGEVEAGGAMAVATGAVIPRGADAMVMVEETDLAGDGKVLVKRPAVPGGRISAAGSDITRGETVLRSGTLLTARETGTLAACGIADVPCRARVRVAIISTGDEIVPPGTPLSSGQVHDANATLLAHAAREIGCDATALGIAPDEGDALRDLFARALGAYDAVLLSGGTSKGGGDLSYRVLGEMADIIVHGVALKPGKPLCLAAHDGKPIALLPGFPTSAIFTYHAFVAPVLRRLAGLGHAVGGHRRARLAHHMRSEIGRAEFTLVNLVRGRDGLLAYPLGKGSGSVTTFARADGFFEVPASTEYVEKDDAVEVTLLGHDVEPADLIVVGSHCTGLDAILSRLAAQGLTVKAITVGSRGGLDAALEEACDVAPVHLYDRETGVYNEPFAREGLRLMKGYGRRQGVAYREEHVDSFGADGAEGDVAGALRRAAGEGALRLANRNPASGTHALVADILEGLARRPPGWTQTYRSHSGVAAAVANGRADYGVCLEQAARGAGLCWRPLKDEAYDFLVPAARWDEPGTAAFRAALADPEVRGMLRTSGFRA
jgi:putative molybdopterin biosynthesis protein